MKNNELQRQDSVPRPTVRAIVPQQAVVKSCPNGIKRLSSSIELGAQHVSPHQKTIKRKRPHLKDMSCLIQFHVVLPNVAVKLLQNKRFLNVRYGFSLQRMQFTKDRKGQPERQDISKNWKNSMAGCCNLLR